MKFNGAVVKSDVYLRFFPQLQWAKINSSSHLFCKIFDCYLAGLSMRVF